jgi:hypothetical protein
VLSVYSKRFRALASSRSGSAGRGLEP